jgi:hypothetical protein
MFFLLMSKRSNLLCLGTTIFTLMLFFAISLHNPIQAVITHIGQQQIITKNSLLPIVDYETEVTTSKSKQRLEKSSHFRNNCSPNNGPIKEFPGDDGPLPLAAHDFNGLPALPIEQSDAIVLGIVGSGAAHLSDDRTGIYSEYSLVVSEILKDKTKALVPGPLAVNRLGGAVRFKSGKIQRCKILLHGVPQTGLEYALFLRQTEAGDLIIITGYELSNSRITPLDGDPGEDPRSRLPFAQYEGAERKNFLRDLRSAVKKDGGD